MCKTSMVRGIFGNKEIAANGNLEIGDTYSLRRDGEKTTFSMPLSSCRKLKKAGSERTNQEFLIRKIAQMV